MKNISNNTFKFLGLVILVLISYRCTQDADYQEERTASEKKNTTIIIEGEGNSSNKIFEEYDALLQAYQEGLYFKDWAYNPQDNNITWNSKENKKAALASHNHILGLAFDNHIAKENKKTLQFQAVSDFANMAEEGPYAKRLLVNGKPYSGVIVGTHLGSNKKILELQLYEGFRIGTFNVWTNLERLYTKSFKERIQMLDVQVVRKPIIYLYPEQELDVNVQVHFKGKLTHTYPPYPLAKGWDLKAQPNGMLTDKATGKQYSYLFWEGVSPFNYTLAEGFVVKGKEVANFLDEKLEILGLNRREATDFISYWLPELEQNPYNLIHFSSSEYCQNAPLEISPAPETLIRVFMVYKPLKEAIDIPTQQLTKASRKGFTVVEWGGKKANEVLN